MSDFIKPVISGILAGLGLYLILDLIESKGGDTNEVDRQNGIDRGTRDHSSRERRAGSSDRRPRRVKTPFATIQEVTNHEDIFFKD